MLAIKSSSKLGVRKAKAQRPSKQFLCPQLNFSPMQVSSDAMDMPTKQFLLGLLADLPIHSHTLAT